MHSVVGCGECGALWVVEGRPGTTTCRSCGSRHRFDALKKFAEVDDADTARETRTRLLAARSDHASNELDSFSELESRAETGGLTEEKYLERSGIDAERVRVAGEHTSGSQSRMDTVREALSELDEPTESDVVAYTEERGVSVEFTERALERLVRRGEASEHRGRYRLL